MLCTLCWATWLSCIVTSKEDNTITQYHIAGNFRGRKLLQILRFCGYLWKFSPRNLGAGRPLVRHKRTIHENFFVKIVFFTNSWKFSPSKVSCYTVSCVACTCWEMPASLYHPGEWKNRIQVTQCSFWLANSVYYIDNKSPPSNSLLPSNFLNFLSPLALLYCSLWYKCDPMKKPTYQV